MTSKGIAAAETTTYMNGMLNELSKSGTTADKTLRATAGQSFKELMASGKSLGEVVQMLEDAAQKSGKSLNDMFGSAEAGKAATSLLSGGVEGFNEQVQGMTAQTQQKKPLQRWTVQQNQKCRKQRTVLQISVLSLDRLFCR